jgi:ABC-type dipeptide/oligopeptide/nickel transport system permease component
VRRYILRRLLQAFGTLIGVSIAIFVLLRVIPGDPITIMMGEVATPDQITAARALWHLDDPLPEQYLLFVRDAVAGDWGESIHYRTSVLSIILERLPATLELTVAAMLLGIAVALPVGILSALRRGTWLDIAGLSLALVGQAMPTYWTGILLILVFAVGLHLLPTSGNNGPLNLILPAVTLGSVVMALLARLTRTTMLEVLNEDYVRTAWAKGLPGRSVILGHAFRNVAVPLVTALGLQIGNLLGGAVVVETVFAWPGIGQLVVSSIFQRDYPVVQGVLMLAATIFVVLNLLVDLSYGYLDPRIRLA